MALFAKRGANSGAFFLDNCTFIGDGLCGSDITNELFDCRYIGLHGQNASQGIGGAAGSTYGKTWRPEGPPAGRGGEIFNGKEGTKSGASR